MKPRRVDWYAVDWLDGVATMPPDQRGVYDTIINLIYAHGEEDGSIETNERELAIRCCCHWRELRRILAALLRGGKVAQDGRKIYVKRCAEELQKARTRIAQAAHNGAKGGRPNGLAKPDGFGDQKAYIQQTTTNNQHTSKEKDSWCKPAVRHRVYARDLERFWQAYPHRGKSADPKKPAADKFAAKVKAGADPEEIIAGAERYAAHVEKQRMEGKFVPQAVKWLTDERWNDEFSEFGAQEFSERKMLHSEQIPADYEQVRRDLEQRFK